MLLLVSSEKRLPERKQGGSDYCVETERRQSKKQAFRGDYNSPMCDLPPTDYSLRSTDT